ncbi:MAG TPA: integrin alpha, partial [Candidatus Polarisedimenticolia bacterium]|nr:integrin alpha [Candidatus Polarisedimenticolia bacterium]
MRARAWGLAGGLSLLLFLQPTSTGEPFSGAAANPSGTWSSQVQNQIQRSEYNFSLHGGDWSAPNRAHDLRSRVTPDGIEVVSRTRGEAGFKLMLSLTGIGRERSLRAMPHRGLSASERRAEIDRGDIVEWLINDERGLEHGFSIPAPHDDGHGPFVLTLSIDSTLLAYPEGDTSILFKDAAGKPALRYGGLQVRDAHDDAVPTRFVIRPGSISIEIEDGNAVYPLTVDPLLTSAAWTAEGDQAGGEFGQSVATAGDVNGDGYSDVIVGADYYDNGQTDEGRAFVYLGSASGLATSPAWTAESDQVGANFGGSASTAGDVNGDGFSDVIVGSINYENGQIDEGRAYVYLGSASGLATSPAWTAEGDQDYAWFGYSVATAGDVNGDGYSDVIVGAIHYIHGPADEKRAYVYLGSSSGLATLPAWTAQNAQFTANFGASVSTAGDINGDGYSDIIIGAPYYTNDLPNEGRAYVYLGSASGLALSSGWTAEGDQDSAYFGTSVSTAGDVNGDGYSDVIVGAYLYDNVQADEGRAYVYLGSASGLASTPVWSAESDQVGAQLGISVSTAGDVNGDGYADVIIGATNFSNGQTSEGRAYLYLGSASGPAMNSAWTAESDQADAYLGYPVATAGDVNGDGYSDVIVAATWYDNGQLNEGRAYVYLGSADVPATTASWNQQGEQAGEEYGYSLSSAGDVNGDGFSDVIIGAWGYDNGQGPQGRAFVYLGSGSGLSSLPSWSADGEASAGGFTAFGFSVAGAGDVNADGYDDVIVGAYNHGVYDQGAVFVFLGSGAGLNPSPAWMVEGDLGEGEFGRAVSSAGDVNGDGYSDVIVGGSTYSGPSPSQHGISCVWLGSYVGLKPSTRPADADWCVFGQQATDLFGYVVADAGDVNGDGFGDVVVGDPYFDNGLTYEGRVYLYLGSS